MIPPFGQKNRLCTSPDTVSGHTSRRPSGLKFKKPSKQRRQRGHTNGTKKTTYLFSLYYYFTAYINKQTQGISTLTRNTENCESQIHRTRPKNLVSKWVAKNQILDVRSTLAAVNNSNRGSAPPVSERGSCTWRPYSLVLLLLRALPRPGCRRATLPLPLPLPPARPRLTAGALRTSLVPLVSSWGRAPVVEITGLARAGQWRSLRMQRGGRRKEGFGRSCFVCPARGRKRPSGIRGISKKVLSAVTIRELVFVSSTRQCYTIGRYLELFRTLNIALRFQVVRCKCY